MSPIGRNGWDRDHRRDDRSRWDRDERAGLFRKFFQLTLSQELSLLTIGTAQIELKVVNRTEIGSALCDGILELWCDLALKISNLGRDRDIEIIGNHSESGVEDREGFF